MKVKITGGYKEVESLYQFKVKDDLFFVHEVLEFASHQKQKYSASHLLTGVQIPETTFIKIESVKSKVIRIFRKTPFNSLGHKIVNSDSPIRLDPYVFKKYGDNRNEKMEAFRKKLKKLEYEYEDLEDHICDKAMKIYSEINNLRCILR